MLFSPLPALVNTRLSLMCPCTSGLSRYLCDTVAQSRGDEALFRCTPPLGGSSGRSELDPSTSRPSLLLLRELIDQVWIRKTGGMGGMGSRSRLDEHKLYPIVFRSALTYHCRNRPRPMLRRQWMRFRSCSLCCGSRRGSWTRPPVRSGGPHLMMAHLHTFPANSSHM